MKRCIFSYIKKIFSGELTSWNQVDASLPDEKINVYIRDLSGGAYEVFQKSIMKDSQVTDTATQSASMTELANNVAGDKWGIGYVGYGAFNKANKETWKIRKKYGTTNKTPAIESMERKRC